MAKILVKNESVYECDVCKRRTRVPTDRTGIDVVQRCIITTNCQGKLHRLVADKDVNDTPAISPEVQGVQDWAQRKLIYTHNQQVQSMKWVVNHNMGGNPNTYVYANKYVDGVMTLVQVTPTETKIINNNQIILLFDQAVQGLAQCIAFTSRNSVNPNTTAGVKGTTADIVITNSGELTLATLVHTPTTSIQMYYNSTSMPTPSNVEYLSVGNASILSAWAGANFVIVNGKKYMVRSYNIVTTQLAPNFFQAGVIDNGSMVYFSPTKTPIGQQLILLSSAPHATVDRIYDRYIDTSVVTSASPTLYYNTGELFAVPSIIKNLYPPIIVA